MTLQQLLRTVALAALVSGTSAAAASVSAAPPSEIGTTIVGDEDTAVGLNLSPWQNEPPPDIDLPPALYNDVPAAADFASQAEHYESITAYRRRHH